MYKMAKITLKDIAETVKISEKRGLNDFTIELTKEKCGKSPKQFAEEIKNFYRHDAKAPYGISVNYGSGIAHVNFYKE
jgi:hypothetical protein